MKQSLRFLGRQQQRSCCCIAGCRKLLSPMSPSACRVFRRCLLPCNLCVAQQEKLFDKHGVNVTLRNF